MAAKYLKSLTTGVVLPYNEPALKNANMRLMEPAECEAYEQSLNKGSAAAPKPAPEPAPEPEPVVEEVAVVEEEPVVEEPFTDVEGVLGALEVE